MSFNKITILKSKPIVMQVENIDTDQIIPARFLKTTSREGFGKYLFYDWRSNFKGEGTILVAGRNFGCGSSREHAAWAIYDFGIRAVVSSFFADIFKSNALNNGLLPVQVSQKFLDNIFSDPDTNLEIDLGEKTITNLKSGEKEFFEISSYKQNCLMKGYDDIDYLLANIEEIENFKTRK